MAERTWLPYVVPSEHRRINEFVGLVLATLAILIALSLVSFNPDDPSFNISTNPRFAGSATNFVGVVGSYIADLFFQTWGFSAFLIPIFLGVYAFYWLASWPVKNFWTRFFGNDADDGNPRCCRSACHRFIFEITCPQADYSAACSPTICSKH